MPAPWDGDELAVGAGSVRVVPVGWSDVEVSSVVHIGERETVVAGDVAYNGMHMWLAGSTPQSRAGWIASLDAVEKLGPRVIIAGHRDPQAPDDDAARILDESRRYVQDFGDAVGSSSGPEELIATMLARHGTLGNPYTLWVAAHSQFVLSLRPRHEPSSPAARMALTSCTRERTSILRKTDRTWVATVFIETPSISAADRFVFPSPMSRATRASASVSAPQPVTGRGAVRDRARAPDASSSSWTWAAAVIAPSPSKIDQASSHRWTACRCRPACSNALP